MPKFVFLTCKLKSDEHYSVQRMFPIPKEYIPDVKDWIKWAKYGLYRSRRDGIAWMTLDQYSSGRVLRRWSAKDLFSMVVYQPLSKFEVMNLKKIKQCPFVRHSCFKIFLKNFERGGWFIGCHRCFPEYYK